MAENISSKVAWRLRKAIKATTDSDAPQRGTARVMRRDSTGTVWLRFPGSSVDTPVTGAVVANVDAGDVITYAIQGGRVSIDGNASDPSVGERVVGTVRKVAARAASLASSAKAIAEATGQHFWHDDNGAHISTTDRDPAGARNAVWNSLGMLFRAGTTNLLAIVAGTDSGMDVYDGQGNDEDNIIASHRGSGSRIGRSGESHMELDYHSLRMVDKEGNGYFEVEDLRNRDGVYSVTETVAYEEPGDEGLAPAVIQQYDFPMQVTGFSVTLDDDTDDTANWQLHQVTSPAVYSYITRDNGTVYGDVTFYGETNSSNAKMFTFGTRNEELRFGEGSVAMGNLVAASGLWSHGEGSESRALGEGSHAEGRQTIAFGRQSHAEGWYTKANGSQSHAEGLTSVAGGDWAHAEGRSTEASGEQSHAEGWDADATGSAAHAEGRTTKASGWCSHAQNYGTIAAYECQTAIGKYNYNDPDNAFEIGNGLGNVSPNSTYTNRSNAFTVGWNGDLTYQGTLHGATWLAGTSGTPSGGVTTLPSSGTYILVTAHNSTPALNGIWIVRTGGNAAFNIAGGGNVTVAVSGTTLTVTTTAGTVNVYYQLCG